MWGRKHCALKPSPASLSLASGTAALFPCVSLSSLSRVAAWWVPLVSFPCSVAIGTSSVSRWISDLRLVSFGTFGPPREPFISSGSTVHSSPRSRARFQTRPRRFKVSRWILHQRPTLIAPADARAHSPLVVDRPIQDRRPTNLHVVGYYLVSRIA